VVKGKDCFMTTTNVFYFSLSKIFIAIMERLSGENGEEDRERLALRKSVSKAFCNRHDLDPSKKRLLKLEVVALVII
jgi:hypothetical protein